MHDTASIFFNGTKSIIILMIILMVIITIIIIKACALTSTVDFHIQLHFVKYTISHLHTLFFVNQVKFCNCPSSMQFESFKSIKLQKLCCNLQAGKKEK